MRGLTSGLSLLLVALSGCSIAPEAEGTGPEWAIAIHGGAGTISREMPEATRQAYLSGLERALKLGRSILDEGGTSLDAVERVIRVMEDDPGFNAGKGAVFNHAGGHELDASIMDGRDLSCGAVAGVTTVKNPISLARRVMERTGHVLLGGAGAEAFAAEQGVERVEPGYFFTERRYEQWRSKQADAAGEKGTVGVAALDRHGSLAAGTSTGGLTDKLYGRIGDSPIVGAGTYADNRTCAVSGTGVGEEFIRHGVAAAISFRVGRGQSLDAAVEELVGETLRPGDGGVIAVDRHGNIALRFNTEGMYRGAADSNGRFEVAIWE